MRVAIVDVGSNTARLLIAERGSNGPVAIAEAKAHLGLGAEILEHGVVREHKLDELATELRGFRVTARDAGVLATDVFLTAPGRQAANVDQLTATVARAMGHVARVLSADEEGELAYEGAVITTPLDGGPVAVCDVGGGSTELVIGDPRATDRWTRSVDVGSLRLTAALLDDDPPTNAQLARAEDHVHRRFAALDPPGAET